MDGLLDGARRSRGGSLVIRGEPGVGKSALLDWAAEHAGPTRVLRATGVESEIELPFATLHQLLRPVTDEIDQLPAGQAAALHGALGSGPGRGEDRFLVGVGLLTLLADVASERGLVCIVDDAQWADSASIAALEFLARRLHADGIALLMAIRDTGTDSQLGAGLPELNLLGLDGVAAAALLTHVAPTVSSQISTKLIEATAGNPLALIELPTHLDNAQLAGNELLPEPVPIGTTMQLVFARAAAALPAATRMALCLAAADDTGRVDVLARAAEVLALDLEAALAPAEHAALIQVVAARVRFRHPLVRSAIYQQETFQTRQTAHRALASALNDAEDLDRRAWHLAAAATLPDTDVADALEAAAIRARSRAGPGPAAAAYRRAAALTPEPSQRHRRLVSAAEATWTAGHPTQALALLDQAELSVADAGARADQRALRALIELSGGSPATAYRLLVTAAAEAGNQDQALSWLALAGEAAFLLGDVPRMIDLRRRVSDPALNVQGSSQVIVHLLVGVANLASGEWDDAAARLRSALKGSEGTDDPLALLRGGHAALLIGDETSARRIYHRAAALVRRTGAVGLLATTLDRLAFADALSGRLADAELAASEAITLAHDLDQQDATAMAVLALVEAWRGTGDRCRAHAAQAIALADLQNLGAVFAGASWALGLLDLSMGRPGEALARLAPIVANEGLGNPAISLWATPDLVEAAARSGNPETGRTALRRFGGWAQRIGAPWSIAAARRGVAQLADEGLDLYAEAVERHDGTRPLDRARTRLSYGEALRRAHRRVDARVELKAALETFEGLGADPWAERARAELRATGETVARAGPGTRDRLTPQELQISRLAADGASNSEIAEQLFLSRKTVEYHLHKVFTKLGITSRIELTKVDLGDNSARGDF
jgi:DNA-binding CsgD family transcriptional regulator/tetratricopeptide (TPR) repeat protein